MATQKIPIVIPNHLKPGKGIIEKMDTLFQKFRPLEVQHNLDCLLLKDEKSGAFYVICHLVRWTPEFGQVAKREVLPVS